MSVASENCVTSESRKIGARADLIPGMCIFSISDQEFFFEGLRGCVLNADWVWRVFL